MGRLKLVDKLIKRQEEIAERKKRQHYYEIVIFFRENTKTLIVVGNEISINDGALWILDEIGSVKMVLKDWSSFCRHDSDPTVSGKTVFNFE